MKNLETWLMKYIRRAWLYWPARAEAKKKARVGRANGKYIYQCSSCNGEFEKIHVDHKRPVIPIKGFDTWDKVINRLFCSARSLQILCKECHREKTQRENHQRRKYR